MESSDFTSNSNNTDANASTTGSSPYGASGTTGSTGSTSAADGAADLKDRARSAMDTAGEKLGDVGSTVRDRAAGAKDSLANVLEVGAEKLRARSEGSMAGAGAAGGSIALADDKLAQVSSTVAGGMENASAWLRDADMNSLKASVEAQVKEHPGRTLLIAAGIGYLLGKALRK